MTDVDNNLGNTALLSDLTYDRLRFLVQIFLPAFATLYFTLGSIANLPNPTGVVAALAAIATFGGVLLKASRSSYDASDGKYAGAINVVTAEDGGKMFSLELNGDPSELESVEQVTFKINSPPA